MAKKKSLIDLIQEAIDKGANSAEEIHRQSPTSRSSCC